jgi:hypothetical protein
MNPSINFAQTFEIIVDYSTLKSEQQVKNVRHKKKERKTLQPRADTIMPNTLAFSQYLILRFERIANM